MAEIVDESSDYHGWTCVILARFADSVWLSVNGIHMAFALHEVRIIDN